MLIIPVERSIDWQRAPVCTGLIILVCCLVFFGWQWRDEALFETTIHHYLDDGLLPLEYGNFISHLYQMGEPELAAHVEQLKEEGDLASVSYFILSDRSFTEVMKKTDIEFWGKDIFFTWKDARAHINQSLDDISSFKLGLMPAESRVITYITYQFMHGDTLHLVGNMIILALTGVAVEAAIGSFNFLLCYLLCGLFAGVTFTLFNWNSWIPLVGASGSISGVMGMYAALYGFRRIKFFYSIVFYFGYFTAPAIAILPLWVAWELFNAFLREGSGVAYLAHAGGLIAGASIILLGRRFLIQVEERYLDQETDADEEYRVALDGYLKQLSSFNFDAARRKLEKLELAFPDKLAVKEFRYNLEKLDASNPVFHDSTHKLLATNTTQLDYMHLFLDIYRDYQTLESKQPFSDALLIKLMLNFCQIEGWDAVRELTKEAQTRGIQDPMLVKILINLSTAMKAKGEKDAAERYREMAKSLSQQLSLKDINPLG